jgi:transcriptional regulator with XRE-family HTH domain
VVCGFSPKILLFFACYFIIDKGYTMIAKIQDRIIAVREALEMTQRDFCRGIYVSQSYYAQIEKAARPINDRIIALICSQYGVSKEYLQTGRGEMFSENLPDIQLNQLLEIFNELDPFFRDYIVKQIRELAETLKKSKQGQEAAPKGSTRPS